MFNKNIFRKYVRWQFLPFVSLNYTLLNILKKIPPLNLRRDIPFTPNVQNQKFSFLNFHFKSILPIDIVEFVPDSTTAVDNVLIELYACVS